MSDKLAIILVEKDDPYVEYLGEDIQKICMSEDLDLNDINAQAISGDIDKNIWDDIMQEVIYQNECCSTVRIKYWKENAEKHRGKLTKHSVYQMLEWDITSDAFDQYGDENSVDSNGELVIDKMKSPEFIEINFGYSLYQWGVFIILIGGFSA